MLHKANNYVKQWCGKLIYFFFNLQIYFQTPQRVLLVSDTESFKKNDINIIYKIISLHCLVAFYLRVLSILQTLFKLHNTPWVVDKLFFCHLIEDYVEAERLNDNLHKWQSKEQN